MSIASSIAPTKIEKSDPDAPPVSALKALAGGNLLFEIAVSPFSKVVPWSPSPITASNWFSLVSSLTKCQRVPILMSVASNFGFCLLVSPYPIHLFQYPF